MEADLVVVGAGPAGLCAAVEAANAGAGVLVIDENPEAGGQKFRAMPSAEGVELLAAVRSHPAISILADATVWGLFDQRVLAVFRSDRTEMVRAKAIVIAAGAYERVAPFPGWTLPGVLSAGGALTLLKAHRIVPGRRVLLAGSGPLLVIVAQHLLKSGAGIVALLEASSAMAWWRKLPGLAAEWRALREGLRVLRQVRAAGAPVLTGHTLLRVDGDQQVRRAVATRIDQAWTPIPGSERHFEVDAVVCGFGLVPSIELSSLAGCAHRYEPRSGGWIPVRDGRMETTVPGIFVAGESGGVAGAAVAMEEGRIAGLAAARRLGAITDSEADARSACARRRLRRLRRWPALLGEICAPRAGLLDVITPETIVCRCEEVPAREIAEAACVKGTTLKDLKARTRVGMGHCQGRLCAPVAAALLARDGRIAVEALGPPSVRPPAKPVPLGALSELP
jgi:thioredoxin reductase